MKPKTGNLCEFCLYFSFVTINGIMQPRTKREETMTESTQKAEPPESSRVSESPREMEGEEHVKSPTDSQKTSEILLSLSLHRILPMLCC